MIRNAKLDLGIDIETVKNETRGLMEDSGWLPHFNTLHYDGNWKVLSLRSPGGKSNVITPDLLTETVFGDTPLMKHFSSVKNFITKLACPVLAVRLLNLKSGSVIKAHRDHDLCFEKGEARLHIPVFTNPEVEFFIDEEKVIMQEGECWYINANRPHRVSNRSDFDRIHLVIDCVVNPWLKNIFEGAEKVLVQEEADDEELLKIINELKLQGTETANRLADQLLQQMNAKPHK